MRVRPGWKGGEVMKLSKAESKKHLQAMDLVHSDRALSIDERAFILENYHESQGQLNSLAGAFFTPEGLARDVSIEVPQHGRIVDLCAGIGMLSFWCSLDRKVDVTCVEQCEEYVTVGRRVVPDARWIHGDVFSADVGLHDTAISNPPFGRVKETTFSGKYTGGEFEFKVIERARQVARYGVFILPQQSAPFRYSGQNEFRLESSEKVALFIQQTGIQMSPSCGIDTGVYLDQWKGVSPLCEVVCCDFDAPAAAVPAVSVDLFGEPLTLREKRRARIRIKSEVEQKARAAL